MTSQEKLNSTSPYHHYQKEEEQGYYCLQSPTFIYLLFGRSLRKAWGRKKKMNFGKDLTNEERIYLICEDAKLFYKEFHNGPCIVERYIDFDYISDYQLDKCFNFIHLRYFACEKTSYFPNLVAMFYANLRIKKDPLTLFSLFKRTMITLNEEKLGEILGINASRPQIFGEIFSFLGWSETEALAMLFRVRSDEVYRNENSFPINYHTPRAHVLAKIAQFNFFPQGGRFHVIKMDCLLLLYAMLSLTNFNLS